MHALTVVLGGLEAALGKWEIWVPLLVIVGVIVFLRYRGGQSESISIGLPFGLGNITYTTAPVDRLVAWQFYIQLVTRKAALPFNENEDLISEVHESLYQLFADARQLLLRLPPRGSYQRESLADLMLRVLNDGLRPHLTRWHSKYRKWWDEEIASAEARGVSPQDIQRRFPQYEALTSDLRIMNVELARFADELRDVARRGKREIPLKRRIAPVAPTNTALAESEFGGEKVAGRGGSPRGSHLSEP